MSLEVHSLGTMRSPLLALDGPVRAKRPQRRRVWALLLVVLALGATLVLAHRAAPATGQGSCPSARSFRAGGYR